ncbi:GNAT family N-acetyltransferase [Caballeronia sp. GAOx1]|uniref:GNAT family N-acetyltransferase n=1 Tax=Caballeronia sp. GAOx1 TaxID=2921761 RepID=UPI00254180A0|nr:GNAT family N-acetyltransferase [Caballeronia sp. GAOx1]
MEVVRFESSHAARWDAFCDEAVNGTFLHTRRFLSYHGDRFKDVSALLIKDGEILGAFPAAESPHERATVVSHPGVTYGGIVHAGGLNGGAMIEALGLLRQHYASEGYGCIRYKAVPHVYQIRPSQDDLYALFRLGARRSRCDLSCAIDLENRARPSERRRRGLKKALRSVSVEVGARQVRAFWPVLTDNLSRKHDAAPVHDVKEMERLIALFPGGIELVCAKVDDRVEAGVVVFKTRRAWHAQYIAASETAYAMSALDAVFDRLIADAASADVRFFDFGTSNEREGLVLNEGLYQYKHEFGGGGVVHEFYDLDLTGAHHVGV